MQGGRVPAFLRRRGRHRDACPQKTLCWGRFVAPRTEWGSIAKSGHGHHRRTGRRTASEWEAQVHTALVYLFTNAQRRGSEQSWKVTNFFKLWSVLPACGSILNSVWNGAGTQERTGRRAEAKFACLKNQGYKSIHILESEICHHFIE